MPARSWGRAPQEEVEGGPDFGVDEGAFLFAGLQPFVNGCERDFVDGDLFIAVGFLVAGFGEAGGADKDDAPRSDRQREPKLGDLVRLKSLGREGRVSRVIDAKTLEVAVGSMKMRVPKTDVAEVVAVAAEARRVKADTESGAKNLSNLSSGNFEGSVGIALAWFIRRALLLKRRHKSIQDAL